MTKPKKSRKPRRVVLGAGQREWRRIADSRYEVSDSGAVRVANGATNSPVGKMMGIYENRHGYLETCLSISGQCKHITVHSLVAGAFIGPRPLGMEINHKNGIKTDNRLENLEYVTPNQNKAHAIRMRLTPAGERNHNSKLRSEDIAFIRSESNRGITSKEIAKRLSVSLSIVSRIRRRESWTHI